jgi:hypothetical protein
MIEQGLLVFKKYESPTVDEVAPFWISAARGSFRGAAQPDQATLVGYRSPVGIGRAAFG